MDNRLPHPAATRMLLTSDGSTTRLLEGLLNEELTVKVIQQQVVSSPSIAPFIVQSLEAEKDDSFIERCSMLITSTGEWVSRNYVICRLHLPPEMLKELELGALPIGKIWSQIRLSGHRMLLGYGTMSSSDTHEHLIVPYKHYVLWNDTAPLMYIREQFSTRYVSLPPAEEGS